MKTKFGNIYSDKNREAIRRTVDLLGDEALISELMSCLDKQVGMTNCAKACLHGTTHRLVDDGLLRERQGRAFMFWLAEQMFTDECDEGVEGPDYPGGFLPGETDLEPEKDWPEAFGSHQERRQKALSDSIQRRRTGEIEDIRNEQAYDEAIAKGWSVLDLYHVYGTSKPYALGKLADTRGPIGQAELLLAVSDAMQKVAKSVGDSPELKAAQDATWQMINQLQREEEANGSF